MGGVEKAETSFLEGRKDVKNPSVVSRQMASKKLKAKGKKNLGKLQVSGNQMGPQRRVPLAERLRQRKLPATIL